MIYKKQLTKCGDHKRLARQLAKAHAKLKKKDRAKHPKKHVSIRTAEHNGHRIEVLTSYEIRIDGTALEGHMGVESDGRVHYHPIPNYSSASMIDLTKDIIHSFPDDFPKPAKKKPKGKTKAKAKKKKSKHGGH